MLSQPAAVVEAVLAAPLVGSVLYGGAIYYLGDHLAQQLNSGGQAEPCHARAGKAGLLGAGWAGLIAPQVYALAEGLFPGRKLADIALKTCVSVSILATFGNYFNMLARRLMGGLAWSQAVAAVHRDFWGVVRPPPSPPCFHPLPTHSDVPDAAGRA